MNRMIIPDVTQLVALDPVTGAACGGGSIIQGISADANNEVVEVVAEETTATVRLLLVTPSGLSMLLAPGDRLPILERGTWKLFQAPAFSLDRRVYGETPGGAATVVTMSAREAALRLPATRRRAQLFLPQESINLDGVGISVGAPTVYSDWLDGSGWRDVMAGIYFDGTSGAVITARLEIRPAPSGSWSASAYANAEDPTATPGTYSQADYIRQRTVSAIQEAWVLNWDLNAPCAFRLRLDGSGLLGDDSVTASITLGS